MDYWGQISCRACPWVFPRKESGGIDFEQPGSACVGVPSKVPGSGRLWYTDHMGTGVTVEVDCSGEKSWKFAVDWKGLKFEKLREVFQSVAVALVSVVEAEIRTSAVALKKRILMRELT